MGDEGGVMKLLMEMMTFLDDHTNRAGWTEDGGGCDGIKAISGDGGGGGGACLSSDPCVPPARHEPAPPEPSRSETGQRWSDVDDDYLPPTASSLPAARRQLREQRRKVLRLAGEKLVSIEERERTQKKEKDLRKQLLLTTMSARLEAEVRAERMARTGGAVAGRQQRSYSRTLGRSFCSRPSPSTSPKPAPVPSLPAPAPTGTSPFVTAAPSLPLLVCETDAASTERRKRRREADASSDLLGDEVRDLLSEFGLPSPPSPADCDEDFTSKRLRFSPFYGYDADQDSVDADARCPQDQIRYFGPESDQLQYPGCGAAAAAANGLPESFQWSAHQLVPSLES